MYVDVSMIIATIDSFILPYSVFMKIHSIVATTALCLGLQYTVQSPVVFADPPNGSSSSSTSNASNSSSSTASQSSSSQSTPSSSSSTTSSAMNVCNCETNKYRDIYQIIAFSLSEAKSIATAQLLPNETIDHCFDLGLNFQGEHEFHCSIALHKKFSITPSTAVDCQATASEANAIPNNGMTSCTLSSSAWPTSSSSTPFFVSYGFCACKETRIKSYYVNTLAAAVDLAYADKTIFEYISECSRDSGTPALPNSSSSSGYTYKYDCTFVVESMQEGHDQNSCGVISLNSGYKKSCTYYSL